MDTVTVKIRKYRVGLRRINEDHWEETKLGEAGDFEEKISVKSRSPETQRSAITQAVARFATMNMHNEAYAKENNEPFFYKLIVINTD